MRRCVADFDFLLLWRLGFRATPGIAASDRRVARRRDEVGDRLLAREREIKVADRGRAHDRIVA
jgi:hypothetical protein